MPPALLVLVSPTVFVKGHSVAWDAHLPVEMLARSRSQEMECLLSVGFRRLEGMLQLHPRPASGHLDPERERRADRYTSGPPLGAD